MSAAFFDAALAGAQTWADGALSPDERHSARGPRFVRRGANLHPDTRDGVLAYLQAHRVTPHIHFDHLLSSQAFCFDFLFPFRDRPAALADLLRPIVADAVTPVWLPGERGFVAFEYVSGPDYLNEGGGRPRTRGSQCTSVDAAVGFVRAGRRELLLIEWKLGEAYGSPVPNRPRADPAVPDSNAERRRRYLPAFARGTIRPGPAFDDFLYDPFYQLLRQQMLAFAIEADREAPESAFERVTLAHVSPAANAALHGFVAPGLRPHYPEGADACAGWSALLTQPDRYVPVSVEALFAAFPVDRHPALRGWHRYMRARYAFLDDAP